MTPPTPPHPHQFQMLKAEKATKGETKVNITDTESICKVRSVLLLFCFVVFSDF